MASAEISLNPPSACKREDGSAYHKAIMKRAQVLEKVKRIPVNIITCMIHWRVNVGWCGGEFAIESYMHNDLETLRSTIIHSTTQCNEAELDGTISITTPSYGSIQPLDLKLKLQGGVGNSMFQPSGFRRPDSWCKGYPFFPPKNVDDAIEYVDYRAHYEKKQLWPTEEIRRAVVTYRFTAQVQKTQGYIIDEGKSLVLPNTLVISRNRDVEIENILDISHYKSIGGKRNANELDSYVDVKMGRIIFNRTNIPRNTCQEYRSVTKIESGELYHSKLDDYAIYRYF